MRDNNTDTSAGEEKEQSSERDTSPIGASSRRDVMKAAAGIAGVAGFGGAGFAGVGGIVSANEQYGGSIELEAVSIENDDTGGQGPPDHAGEQGPPDHAGEQGPPDHAPAHGRDDESEYVWRGLSPEEIDGETNPTLSLIAGEDYVVKWHNTDGGTHNFSIEDSENNTLVESDTVSEGGSSQTVEFTATEEMAEYYCGNHADDMRGSIQVGDPEEGILNVLYLGGVEDGATHYSEDLLQRVGPYLLHRGVAVHYTERQDDLNPDTLSHYDAVVLYGNRLDPTEEQIDALVDFVEDGGGFLPIHSASASFTDSERFIELVGGQFDWHGYDTMTTERIEPDHPIFEGVEEIEAMEETYRHRNLNDDIEVLAYATGGDYEDDEEEPFTWIREQGDGRVFYTAWGHGENVWDTVGFQQKLHNAIRWATGSEDTIGNHPTLSNLPYTHIEEYGHDEIPYYQGDAPDRVSSNDDGVWDYVQDPVSVTDSLSHTVTPAEFDIEPFVSEETLPEDIEGQILDMTFDTAGRCWVSISKDYPNDAGNNEDKIVICEDVDNDGRADEFTVFKDGLSIPLSIIAFGNGVLVSEVGSFDSDGRVVYFGDSDGDDVADEEEVLFTGFGTWDTHAGLNQLHYGIDNWIYGVVGYTGLETEIDGENYSFEQDLFRFRPDGSEMEFIGSGASNMAGVGSNEEGLIFCSSATAGNNVTTYAAIPAEYYNYINGYTGRSTVDIREPNYSRTENENRILPFNGLYRQVDQQGGFTAATDQEVYTARDFPEQYWNKTTFVGEGTGQLLATFYLEQDGAGYSAVYHNNLVVSNDEWVSPTYVNTGPDGQVWMIDFYNYIFQHNPTPDGYENGDGNSYETNVRDDEHGRLHRVTYGDDIELRPHDLSEATPEELVDTLSDDNMFWRKTAQRKLVERGEDDVLDELVDLLRDESVDEIGLNPGAIHALWTLRGLDAIEEDGVLSAVYDTYEHSSAGVRLNAVRVSPNTESTRDAILDADLLNDDDGRVQQWALLKLAETPESDAAGRAIYNTISQGDNVEEDLLADAASVAGATHSSGFIDAYEEEHDPDENDDDDEELPNILTNASFEDIDDGEPTGWQTNTWGGSAEYSLDDSVSRTESNSVRIDSDDGADASWSQEVDVEPNIDYELSGYVRTEGFDAGSGFGATMNAHEVGMDSVTEAVDESDTEDWIRIRGEFNSGSNDQLLINCLFGGWGESTGTVWWDDVALVPLEETGEGIDRIYSRIVAHLEHDDDDGNDDDESPGDVIDPDQTIELDGDFDGWVGSVPESIGGETNPTLTLVAGEEYTVEWTNVDGMFHNFAIRDSEGETPVASDGTGDEGESEVVEFTAEQDVVDYFCQPHPDTMVGDIEVVESDDQE